MKFKRCLLGIAIFAIITTAALLFDAGSKAVGKGKPPGEGITNPAYAYVEDGAIYLMTADGSQKQKLTNPKSRTEDSSPSWSPDLEPDTPGYQGKIAYLNHYEPGYIFGDLFVMNSDGTNRQLVRRFSEFPIPWDGRQSSLAWSPNGKEIVFNSSGDALYAVEIDTGNVRVLVERLFDNRQVYWPAVSSLGMLSFATDGDVYTVDYQLDGNGLMQVDTTTVTNITGNSFDTDENLPAWSPDGTRLAFMSRTELPTGTRIWDLIVYDFVLDEFIPVLADVGPFGNPSWSPDSRHLIFRVTFSDCVDGEPCFVPSAKFNADLILITDWADPGQRLVTNITQTERIGELLPRWYPGW